MIGPGPEAGDQQASVGSKRGILVLILGLVVALVVGLRRWWRGLPD